MSEQYIYMNGSAFNPTSIEADEDKIGESKRMADATLRYYHRAFKSRWTLQWTNIRETFLPAIRAIAVLTTSFIFIDYENVSHTVLVLPGGLKTSLHADKVDGAGLKRYDVTLVLDEA